MQQSSIFDMLGDDFNDYKTKESNDWFWHFRDYPKCEGYKVFSCFACGGGSTMGYKLAGFDVIGCLEIDPRINQIYKQNHNPRFNYVMDIREFNEIPNEELPQELFNLDILDGSPPCTTFSMAGLREETWGKVKRFREGQKAQTLDDLAFVFIETVNKLQPKFVVMENVEGLMKGNAWKYVQEIYKQFHNIGYQVKHWLVKGEKMGIPQRRHRVIFIATRLPDINLDKIEMAFNYKEVPFKMIKSEEGYRVVNGPTIQKLLEHARFGDRNLENACYRLRGKNSFFNYCFIYDDEVAPTITARCNNIRWDYKAYPSKQDIVSMSTFPQDYDFMSDSLENVYFVCGMSVPPIMIKRIAEKIKPLLKSEEQNDKRADSNNN